MLIHVGMDTVKLKGEHFTAKAAQGDTVKKGQLLLEFDPEAIKAAGYETTTPVVVTNAAEFGDITIALGDKTVTAKAAADEVAPAAAAAPAEDHEYDNLPDEQRVAKLIWKYVGGKDNVRNAEHCATRLRLIINDKSKIDEKAIENIDGVKGQFFAAAQYQIILGTGFVDKVFDEFIKGTNFSGVSNKEEAYAQMSTVQKISRTLGDVFVPIIPVLVATGLFMGLRGACQALGLEFSKNVLTMSQVLTDTAFIFLPSLVCWSTMKRFGGTPVIGIVLGLMLVAPELPNAWAAIPGGAQQPMMMDILGFSVPVVGYQGSVLPALVLGIFGAKLQKWLKKFVPDVIDLIVTPFLTLFIGMIVGLLILGPIMHGIETAVFGAVQAFLELPFGIGSRSPAARNDGRRSVQRDHHGRHHRPGRCSSSGCGTHEEQEEARSLHLVHRSGLPRHHGAGHLRYQPAPHEAVPLCTRRRRMRRLPCKLHAPRRHGHGHHGSAGHAPVPQPPASVHPRQRRRLRRRVRADVHAVPSGRGRIRKKAPSRGSCRPQAD